MTVWARSGGCHTEIATSCKSNSRNDEFVNTTPCHLRHCEGRRPVAIHKPLIFYHSQKRKRNHRPLPPSSLRDFVEVVAIHKPQTTTKNRKEKEFTIIYQIKELIFNEILIFNFQFLISYASFISHFVG